MGALCFTLRSHFNVSCKVGLVVMNSQILFVWKTLYLYFNSEEQLFQVEYYWWQVFFFFSFPAFEYILPFHYSLHSSSEKSGHNLRSFPCMWQAVFLLLLLKFSVFNFWQLNYIVSSNGPLWNNLIQNSLGFPDLDVYFPRLGKFLAIISLNSFLPLSLFYF